MRGATAKKLRLKACDMTVGQPGCTYASSKSLTSSTTGMGWLQQDWTGIKASQIRLQQDCTRAVYQQLKKEHN